MDETGGGGRAGMGRGGSMGGSGGGAARGCIRVRHCTGASYRDSGEIKFCISEYKNDAFQVSRPEQSIADFLRPAMLIV